jgi:hypothetical protein
MSLARLAFVALIVKVAFDLGALRRQMKLGFDASDRCRRYELAIGIQNEQISKTMRPRGQSSYGTQGGIDSLVATPARPSIVVSWAVSETIAVRLGLVQRTTGGE